MTKEWDDLPSTPPDATDVAHIVERHEWLLEEFARVKAELGNAKSRIRALEEELVKNTAYQIAHTAAKDNLARIRALEDERTENEGVINVWRRRCLEAEERVEALEDGIRAHRNEPVYGYFAYSDEKRDDNLYKLLND
jgi:chromosome segregation ATPase